MTRLLALTLLIGFFAFLPSASADGDNGLHIIPADVHQSASSGTAVLTLNVSNIQVRAKWRLDGDSPFAITDHGELRLTAELSPTIIVATVIVEDMFSELNRNYQNLTATALITVEFMFGTLRIINPPTRLLAAFGMGGAMALKTSGGMGEQTFRLYSASDYFTLGETSGILSVAASVAVGQYAMTIEVQDETVTLFITVIAEVEAADNLILANAPPLAATVIAGIALSLHTFTASGGLGTLTYALIGSHAGHFSIDKRDGVLRIHGDAEAGVYTLLVEVSDGAIIPQRATAEATIAVVEILFLADTPPLTATAGAVVLLHTFMASGGLGAKTYALIAGNAGYFSIDDNSGVLQMNDNAVAGIYTLSVEVRDGATIPQRATAMATIEIERIKLNELTLQAKVSDRSRDLHVFAPYASAYYASAYSIVAGNDGYFKIGKTSGVLSAQAWTPAGNYPLDIGITYTFSSGFPPRVVVSAVVVEITDYPTPTQSKIYVLGGFSLGGSDSGYKNDVWSSVNGMNWSLETSSAVFGVRRYHQALSHNGRLYVLGGYGKNDVWSSAEGKNWLRETDNAGWSQRQGHQALSHNGRIYVLGGDGYSNEASGNDVWSSADGQNWVRETDAAGWSRRSEHQVLSHNDRLYVLGGSRYKNDVWSSADGQNWVRETDAAGWSGRNEHQALSHNGRIYVLGGQYRTNKFLNDVWSSADGQNWVRETDAAGWLEREQHQAVVFPPSFAWLALPDPYELLFPFGEPVIIHTFEAQYGDGNYTYKLLTDISGFSLSANGELSTDGTAAVGEHTITVQVTDGDGQTKTWTGKVIII